MKRRELVRHLETYGCEFVREGKQHTLYINRETKCSAAVPRHRDIPEGTVRAICRALQIPLPNS